jgi:alpha-mannosidase
VRSASRPFLTFLLCSLAWYSPSAATAQDHVIQEWLIRGPSPADRGRAGVLRDYLGAEPTVLPAPGEEIAGGAWRLIAADSMGRVDLNTLAGQSDWSVAYAHVYLWTPTERPVRLVMDSDDDLVARVNGQRVWVHVVPRGLGPGRDTVRVRLARGWNSVLLKVVNRTGGFGLLARLAEGPGGGPAGDLRVQAARPEGVTAHRLPAARIEVGPLAVRGNARWTDSILEMAADLPVTAWGPDTLRDARVRLRLGRDWQLDTVVALLAPGEPLVLGLTSRFDRLRAAALRQRPVVAEARWGRAVRRDTLVVDAEPLLRAHGGMLDLFDGAPGDTTAPTTLRARLAVPGSFDGLGIDLLARGLGPDAEYSVNGTARDWRDGRVPLCAPCRAGDSLTVALEPQRGRTLWLHPQAQIREPGFAEYADAVRYAAQLGESVLPSARPDPAEWLLALGTPAYARLQQRHAALLAPAGTALARDTLWLVGNSHIDAAWLWRWQETIDVVRNTWRTSLKLAEIFPGYVFAGSSAAFYDAMDRLEPGLADSLVEATRSGSWVPVGGWWVEPDMNMPAGESLVRQGLYGQRYFQRRFGARSRVAWTPDTFGYPWTVPQILTGSGFDYFVTQKIRWNDSTTFPHNAFWWEGKDGTRIFGYNPYGYTHDLDPTALARERVEDRARTGGHHQIVLYGVGDHGGGPTIEMLERAEALRRVPAFPVLRYSGPEPALAAVASSQPADSFPVWRDELYLEYHRGTYTSQAPMKRRNRVSEAQLQAAEALATIDTAPYPRAALEGVWRRVLFNQFHDILPGSGIDSVYLDANATYDTARAMLDSLTAQGLSSLASRMDTRGRGTPVVVFNPVGWARSGRTAVTAGAAGRAGGTGTGDTTWIVVDSVPAFGAVVVHLPTRARSAAYRRLPAPAAGANWIENVILRVEIDTLTGAVTRIYDKRNRREALAAGGRANVLQVLDDRPAQWDAWNLMPNPEAWEVTAVGRRGGAADEDAARFTIERTWGNSSFRQTLVLWREGPYLDIENEVDWRERQKLLKVGFQFAVTPDSATFEIPYGTIGRSGRPRTQAERAKWEVPGQRWADVSAGGHGVAVLNDSKYGWDYRDGRLRLSLLKAAIWPDSTADRGRHRFRFAVYPHAGDWRAARVDRLAAEYNAPLLAAAATSHPGPLGRRVSFASAEPNGVQVTWLKRAEDEEHRVLRVVEWHGRETTASVAPGCVPARAWRANLLEDPIYPLPVDEDRVRLRVHPFEIVTLLVECAR